MLTKTVAGNEGLATLKVLQSDEELHAEIKARLEKDKKAAKYGSTIFDLFLDVKGSLLCPHKLAVTLNTNHNLRGFFYGFQKLKKMGIVEKAGSFKSIANKTKKRKRGQQLYQLTAKAYLKSSFCGGICHSDSGKSNMNMDA